ncbi:hypothetical protein [Flavobacterium sp. 5]|uniref:hypothetical protein n=1 Tax=Flavobacterium sp. 5 TaxID=2035199 RepID=UPI000CACA1EA|nr:hypothetical protein [Flavobacterium sp. 5]PKB16063.1 hypothetical protein CLU82_1178 [Flavobacterium sp. 5]
MKSILKILILFLSCQFCFGQMLTRKTLHGRVVNDSTAIENGLVFNINAKTGDLIDSKGAFSILAKANDTLLVTSLGFKSEKIVLSAADVNSSFYKIKLHAVANELLTVVVYAKHVPHPEFGNTQKIVDTQYFDDKQSTPDNPLMIPSGTGNPNSMDVIRVYNKIFKHLFKNNPEKSDFVTDVSFTNVAIHSVSYSFFTDKLKIKDDQIGLFLLYCENDPKSRDFLDPSQQFEIMDFLINKYDAFKHIASVEK